MNKKKIKEIIVVEGKSDTINLKRFYDVETYQTGGSSIDEQDIERLKKLQESRGLIVFTDPDFQGERIRKIIMAEIPKAQHAFIQRSEGVPKSKSKGRSLGVEHADFAALEEALSKVSTSSQIENVGISQKNLIDLGLILRDDSKQRREFLGQELRIGYSNGKQLLKRLNMFSVSLDKVQAVMEKYIK